MHDRAISRLSDRDEARVQLALSRAARASTVAGQTLYSVVLKPGAIGILPSNAFITWTSLYAACKDVAGGVQVLVDDTLAPAHITAGGPYALDGWRFTGAANFNSARGTATLTIDDGVTWAATGLLIFEYLELLYAGATDVYAIPQNIECNVLMIASRLACTGAGAIFNPAQGTGGFVDVLMMMASELGDGVHAVVKGGVGLATIQGDAQSNVQRGSLTGGGVVSTDASSENGIVPAAGFTLIMQDDAARVAYTPANPAFWQTVPTTAAGGLDEIAAALFNHAEIVSGAIPAAAPVSFSSGNFTSTTGKVRLTAGMQVNGVTSVAGEVVLFKLLMDSAVIAAAPQLAVELSTTGIDAAISGLTFELAGIAAGPHTYGIQAVNSTNGAHTLQVFNLGAFVQIQDTF